MRGIFELVVSAFMLNTVYGFYGPVTEFQLYREALEDVCSAVGGDLHKFILNKESSLFTGKEFEITFNDFKGKIDHCKLFDLNVAQPVLTTIPGYGFQVVSNGTAFELGGWWSVVKDVGGVIQDPDWFNVDIVMDIKVVVKFDIKEDTLSVLDLLVDQCQISFHNFDMRFGKYFKMLLFLPQIKRKFEKEACSRVRAIIGDYIKQLDFYDLEAPNEWYFGSPSLQQVVVGDDYVKFVHKWLSGKNQERFHDSFKIQNIINKSYTSSLVISHYLLDQYVSNVESLESREIAFEIQEWKMFARYFYLDWIDNELPMLMVVPFHDKPFVNASSSGISTNVLCSLIIRSQDSDKSIEMNFIFKRELKLRISPDYHYFYVALGNLALEPTGPSHRFAFPMLEMLLVELEDMFMRDVVDEEVEIPIPQFRGASMTNAELKFDGFNLVVLADFKLNIGRKG